MRVRSWSRGTAAGKRRGLRSIVLAALVLLCLGGCGRNREKQTVWSDGAMLRVGETQVDYREGMVYLDAVQEEYEQYYGSDIWKYAVDGFGNTIGELVKAQTLEQIIYVKVVCKQADALGIFLTEEELLTVEEQTKACMERIAGGNLPLYGVNEDIVRRIYSDNMLARKTFEYATLNVDTDISDEEAGQHRLYSIAIRNFKIDASGMRANYSAEERAELAERMQELHEQAEETDDFYKLADSITEDSSMLELTVGKGDLPAEYEDKVLSLKAGELSDVIETTDYYYIFYCVTEYDVDATYEKKEALIAERQEESFRQQYEEWRAGIEIEVHDEVWDSLDFSTDAQG